MAFDTWKLTDAARAKLVTGGFDLDSDAFRVALFQSTSNLGAASTTYASVTNQVPQANGYTTGGVPVVLNVTGTTVVNVAFATNPSWTAIGGNIVARRAALYEAGGDVLAHLLLDNTPADVITTPGNSLVLNNNGAPYPVLTIS